MRLLLNDGVSLNVESLDDNPLIAAIPKGKLGCVSLLVEAGIDVNKTYILEDGRL